MPSIKYENNTDKIYISNNTQNIYPDYIFIWKDNSSKDVKLKKENTNLYNCISKNYRLIKTTENKLGYLYVINNKYE